MSGKRLLWMLASFVVGAALVCMWYLLSHFKVISPIFLPGPERAWQALMGGLENGELSTQIGGTLIHMGLGWLLASLLGVGLGSAIGISANMRAYLAPTLEFFRPLPASALFPVAIAFLGLSEKMIVIVIGFGALWPTLLATIAGFATTEPRLYEVGRALNIGRWGVITKISIPNALPDILAGMKLSMTVSLILAVTGEIIAGTDGVGLWILLKARSFRSDDVFAGVIVLSLIGYSSTQLIALAERRLLRWQGKST